MSLLFTDRQTIQHSYNDTIVLTFSSSNLESDNWHLSGLNTFPAMEKSCSTGADEAVIDRYLQARIHNSGYVFWFRFQNISGSEFSAIVGCAKYSVTFDGVCVTGGNGALAFMKRKSLYFFVGGDAACVRVSRSGFNSWTRSLRSNVPVMTSYGVHHANFQRGSRAAAIWKFFRLLKLRQSSVNGWSQRGHHLRFICGWQLLHFSSETTDARNN